MPTPKDKRIAYVALLRGINVGGKNLLPMKDLKEMFVAADCSGVVNYIQSGNIVFRAETEVAAKLALHIPLRIEERFGHKPPVLLRTADQLRAVIAGNPFLHESVPAELLHVMFLDGSPTASAVKALDPDRSKPDRFIVQGQEIYIHVSKGLGTSKLTNAYFDSKLKTVSTVRNWRTVCKLVEIATLTTDMLHSK